MAQTDTARSPKTDGAKLRLLRYFAGLTVDEVVQRLDRHNVKISANHLRSVEIGRRNGSPRVLHGLSKVYGTTVSELLIS